MNIKELTLSQIKELLSDPNTDLVIMRQAMAEDHRAGVRQLYNRLLKAEKLREAEHRRLRELFWYEEELWSKGYINVAGVDEAGRGPLAGPVVAAAVILPGITYLNHLNDSKKLTADKRASLELQIKENALAWSIGIADVEEICQKNIHQAGLSAMQRAVTGLKRQPDYLLVDGFKIQRLSIPQLSLVKGDSLSASIAAASILAKVERDRIMDFYDRLYPQYGFARHKGYATPEHLHALKTYGPCPIHRVDFQPVKALIEQTDGGLF